MCTDTGAVKPIVIITVDGGPDENQRFPNVLAVAANHFKNHDLDALFMVTNAPGHSAYNAVERRMAPLSHDLSGLILPHDHFGTHLNESGKVIDQELAKMNFAAAGRVLGTVWSNTVIDKYPVVAEYFEPISDRQSLTPLDENWKSLHVRQSQYLLQIVKCTSFECCGSWRSNLLSIIPNRFLPAPIKFFHRSNGIFASKYDDERGRFGSLPQRVFLQNLLPKTKYKDFPFDYYCPSLQDQLPKRICTRCGLYCPSQAALKRHMSMHESGVSVTVDPLADDEYSQLDQRASNEDLQLPIVQNIFDLFRSPFEDEIS